MSPIQSLTTTRARSGASIVFTCAGTRPSPLASRPLTPLPLVRR
jgi:hypothetical protein